LKTVSGKRATPDDWSQIVDTMVSRGAEGSDEDIATVVKYLSTYLTPDVPSAPGTSQP
jgi:hypothetical protein